MSLTGDVSIELQGQVLRLRLDMNALCHFEAQTKLPPMAWLASYEKGEVTSAIELRAMVHAMLQRHHARSPLSVAGDILDHAPDSLAQVLRAALPQQDDLDEAEGGPGKKLKAPRSMWRRFTAAIFGSSSPRGNSGR